jgi:hypothetical protein
VGGGERERSRDIERCIEIERERLNKVLPCMILGVVKCETHLKVGFAIVSLEFVRKTFLLETQAGFVYCNLETEFLLFQEPCFCS